MENIKIYSILEMGCYRLKVTEPNWFVGSKRKLLSQDRSDSQMLQTYKLVLVSTGKLFAKRKNVE